MAARVVKASRRFTASGWSIMSVMTLVTPRRNAAWHRGPRAATIGMM